MVRLSMDSFRFRAYQSFVPDRRPIAMKITPTRRLAFAVATLAWSLGNAVAQGDPPAPRQRPDERSSQASPAAKPHGNNQNRGRMTADYLWGVTNGNRFFDQLPYARVGQETVDSPMLMDGWTFPFARDAAGRRAGQAAGQTMAGLLFPGINLDDEAGIVTPPVLPGTALVPDGRVGIGSAWSGSGLLGGPSTLFVGGGYHRAPAVIRTNSAPGANPADPSLFSWYPYVPGNPGSVTRYAIRVHIPVPAPSGANENRVEDARYVVHYHMPAPGGGVTYRSKVCTVNQSTAGWKYLNGDDGKPAYFPLLSDASYATGQSFTDGVGFGNPSRRARIELDRSTEGTLTDRYVVADAIELTQRPQSVRSTPVVLGPHGGRRLPTASYPNQPIAGPEFGAADFVNNPLDPAYATNPALGFDPGDFSTVFRGPISLADPRADGNQVAAVDARNHGAYRDSSGNLVPYFSHLQVIVGRSDYQVDPETGVPAAERDGTRSLALGSVWSLDWLTGTPIWRFPDRTHIPGGLRNPQIGTDPAGNPVYQIPGIVTFDRDGDGTIAEDEVFVGGHGDNPDGEIAGGITLAHQVPVLGRVSIPLRDQNGVVTGITESLRSRYASQDPTAPGTWAPVSMPVAYVASANGVVYAIDPYGNNDNRYIENADTTILGRTVAGSTNVLWTFSPTSAPRVLAGPRAETLERYNRRLKTEIPATSAFRGSAPVVAWADEDGKPDIDRIASEPRLFVGNENGVLYALDARANAGIDITTALPAALPFRKGEQTFSGTHPAHSGLTSNDIHRTELRWWFETLGSIASTPAVSAVGAPRTTAVGASKGVYVTTGEGRVYCVDWDGPVTKSDHDLNMVWDGSAGDNPANGGSPILPPPSRSAAAFNDNLRFHNEVAALPGGRPDLQEGTIRPRWTWPNRYRDIDANNNGLTEPIDSSSVYTGRKLAEPTTVSGPILSAPVLIDFPFLDPDSPATLSGFRRYVAVATNDLNADAPDSPKQGRLVLLDQFGDRRDFLTNPMPTRASAKVVPPALPTPAANAVIYSQPVDQFVSKLGPFGTATPVWTYRNVYDTITGAASQPDIAKRNAPSAGGADGKPGRRIVPTIYVGGVGRMFALDFDERTGVFLRWRASGSTQPTPLPSNTLVPGDEAVGDRLNPNDSLNPANPTFNVAGRSSLNLGTKRILARTLPLLGDASSVDGQIVVTAGPLQNRNNDTAETAALRLSAAGAGQTVPNRVSLSAPYAPSVPPIPTDDAPALSGRLSLSATGLYLPFGYDLTRPLLSEVVFPVFDLTGRYGNQDVDDPLATTRGSWPETGSPAPSGGSGQPDNDAYQYPSLFVTTAGGYLHTLNSNIEGEDPSLPTRVSGGGGEPTAALGWATTEDPERFNDLHSYLVSRFGPGGTGTGIAVVTNAYLPARDPGYHLRRSGAGKAGTDPSSRFRFYPANEPNVAAGTPDFGDQPRPHFQPRGVFTGPATATVPLDVHTGQTGQPLDLLGLFYDKRYATPAGTGANEAGQIRLPGYSGLGTAVSAGGSGTEFPETDAERAAANIGLPSGSLPVPGANVNPSGHRATWVFAGGDDGLLYAFTPSYTRRLGGLPMGFVGGAVVRRADPGQGQLKADIFDLPDFLNLRAAAQSGSPLRPSRDGSQSGLPATSPVLSRAAKGKKNFFEFGEVIPIVVWDVTVRSSYDSSTPPAQIPAIPPVFNVTLRMIPRGGQPVTRTVTLERAAGGPIATYPYDRSYSVPPVDTPSGHVPAQLGVAFFEFRVDGSAGLPVAPGVPIEVQVTSQVPVTIPAADTRAGRQIVVNIVGGAFTNQILDRRSPVFFIANPLAVQGFLLDTRSSVAGIRPVSVPKGAGDPPANGIGPFRNGDTAKGLVPVSDSTSLPDPDRSGSEYSQALSNGNTVTRFDPDPYLTVGGSLARNPRFLQRLRDANGGDDPNFYLPVAASAGYVNHGQAGSTDLSNDQRNLRVVNRSLLAGLSRVRVEVMDDLIWRWWPGAIPNADAGSDNQRLTPVGMGLDGRINPLPWETGLTEPQPWKRRVGGATSGSALALGNLSPDYPDILAASAAIQGTQTVSVSMAGGDAVVGPVTLPGGVVNLETNPNPASIVGPLSASAGPFAASVQVRIPRHQPANLVAMHSLTSTYEAPSIEDGAQVVAGNGPVQLPRGIGNRKLQVWNGSGFNGGGSITPYGYTSRMRVYVDANGNGVWDSQNGEEPYRVVELWLGVPVDMGLRSTETPVDLGALPAGFGIQNGNLGYGGTLDASEQAGLAPPPLRQPYAPFFRPFTIQNTGNVNLWNLRASQRVEAPTTPTPGTGLQSIPFGMRSETVDPRFGILSFGADPNSRLFAPNLMPQVVTSLDRSYDAAWDTWFRTGSDPVLRTLMDSNANGMTVYQRYYAPFGGRHTLHKPRPGAPSPSVLGFPDLPSGQSLLPFGLANPEPVKPMVGVAVPHGTPVGTYQSRYSAIAGGPPMLSVFEDHDTDPVNGFAAVPVLNSDGSISAAGPRYSGVNGVDGNGGFRYPGAAPILPATGEGVLRGRALLADASGNPAGLEYQPHTNPAIDLKVTVAETPITGQMAAFDLSQIGFTGLLPGVDAFPVIDARRRPASTLNAAAYRGANGRLNLYYVRNATAGGAARTTAGAPNLLFRTHMNWSEALGTFVASNFGLPVADPFANRGRWFTAPALLRRDRLDTFHYSTPSVLHVSPTSTNALLTWTFDDSLPGVTSVQTVQYARLDANGEPTAFGNWFENPDASVKRMAVRTAYDSAIGTTLAVYHGGTAGQMRLLYSPRGADVAGIPNDTAADGAKREAVEFVVPIPAAVVAAANPSPVFRRIASVGGGNIPVVDVTYSGSLKGAADPDLFLSRFAVRGTGRAARLVPVTLPLVRDERLVQEGRDLVWRGRHVSWVRDLGNRPFLPQVVVSRADGSNLSTDARRWQYDNESEVLYQAIASAGGVLYVYVDTAAGFVRFRGAGAPTSRDTVRATYQPQTYRLTADALPDVEASQWFDNTLLAPGTGVYPGVVRRPGSTPLPTGRQWIFWRKGAAANRPATIHSSARRVGIDLRSESVPAVGRLNRDETILLSEPTTPGGPQVPVVASVSVAGVGPVPYEVDFVNGRIYVASEWEGQDVTVRYAAVRGAASQERTATAVLEFVEELGATDASSIGSQVPMQSTVNEGQVTFFVDRYDATARLARTNGPAAAIDPTLLPGRVWMFWTSSRARVARPQVPGDALPNAFDLLYQTLAPNFEIPSFSARF